VADLYVEAGYSESGYVEGDSDVPLSPTGGGPFAAGFTSSGAHGCIVTSKSYRVDIESDETEGGRG
jgi:hypothetical protein